MAGNSKYNSLGNRRDKNLADVGNKASALNNLLDGISGSGTFISEDLDAIRGLQFEKVSPQTLGRLADSTVTVTDPANTTGLPIPADPLVTIRDRVQNAKAISGEIPAYYGGLGLDARFIKSQDINASNVNSTAADLFVYNSSQILEPNYWEYGYFQHGSQLEPSFSDQYGGILWTGYFSPTIFNRNPTWLYRTSGLLIVEYDIDEANVWVKAINVYAQTRQINVTSSSSGDTVQIAANNYMIVGTNDKLLTNPNITVTGVNSTHITLSSNFSVTAGQQLSITKDLGVDLTENNAYFPVVEPGNQIKIRISYWYPNNGASIPEMFLEFDHNGSTLPFFHMYSEKTAAPGPEELRTFLEETLSPYNTNIGEIGVLGSNYKDISVAKTYINDYTPPKLIADVRTAGPMNLTFTANSKIVTTNLSIENINVGDYLVPGSTAGNILPLKTQVKSKMEGDNTIIITNAPSVSGTYSFNFYDHKGLIDWVYATSTGTTVTINASSNTVSNTINLDTNNVVIVPGTFATHTRITNIIGATSFSTSVNLGLTTNQPALIYSEKGLTDRSKMVFCQGVFGRTLFANAAPGNTMVVTSNAGIVVGQVAQFTGYISESPMTTVTAVVGNTVSLSGTTPITNQILQNSTITFSPAGTSVNKEICVIPLDTAFPFLGANDGLLTISPRGIKASASLTQDFEVSTSNLVFVTNASAITTVSGVQQYDRKIRLNNNQYFILGKVV